MNLIDTDRITFWLGLYGLILLSWLILFAIHGIDPAVAPSLSNFIQNQLCLSAAQTNVWALFGMWVLMSLAMMLPTSIAAIRVFDELPDSGGSPRSALLALVGGYVVIWIGFSAFGALAQNTLAAQTIVDQHGASLSSGLNAGLLFLAGFYQFSSLKNSCLTRCRHPLSFFLERWQPGPKSAFRMGLQLGFYCLGCCWALMALGFVGGTMNLVWMGAATLLMSMEKLPASGQYLTVSVGISCIMLGALFAAKVMFLI